jgi:sugar phosphate isomerase/epimerase
LAAQQGNFDMFAKNTRSVTGVGVVIVASAFGADAIRRDGHAAFVASAANAGAAGFEVRRELFAQEREAQPDALRELGAQIRAAGMWSVFSTPATLFDAAGALDVAALIRSIAEADALGARIVKLQLGGAADGAATDTPTLSRLADLVDKARPKVVVENGQQQAGGTIAAFARLFDALAATPHRLAMTFDTANWLWAQQDPHEAARMLTRQVGYVHCKATTGEGARRYACAPQAHDENFAALLRLLPRDVPRGIEFPFDPHDCAVDAALRVKQIASA